MMTTGYPQRTRAWRISNTISTTPPNIQTSSNIQHVNASSSQEMGRMLMVSQFSRWLIANIIVWDLCWSYLQACYSSLTSSSTATMSVLEISMTLNIEIFIITTIIPIVTILIFIFLLFVTNYDQMSRHVLSSAIFSLFLCGKHLWLTDLDLDMSPGRRNNPVCLASHAECEVQVLLQRRTKRNLEERCLTRWLPKVHRTSTRIEGKFLGVAMQLLSSPVT